MIEERLITLCLGVGLKNGMSPLLKNNKKL